MYAFNRLTGLLSIAVLALLILGIATATTAQAGGPQVTDNSGKTREHHSLPTPSVFVPSFPSCCRPLIPWWSRIWRRCAQRV